MAAIHGFSFHVIDRMTKTAKCTKMRKARAMSIKVLFFNLRLIFDFVVVA